MRAGDQFPPIDVFFDGQNYWLVDGFHRLQAHVLLPPVKRSVAGYFKARCKMHNGTATV